MTVPARVMYEVVAAGTRGFNADVLKFTDDKAVATQCAITYNAELWEVTYVDQTWTRWKEERIEYTSPNRNQLSLSL